MELPSTGFDDFLMIIGWAASSSTFLYGGSMEGWIFSAGAADSVGFFSNSKSISTYKISLLMGACVRLGLLVITAYTFFAPFSLIKLSSFATIRSYASSKSSILILSFLSIFIISRSNAINSLLKLYWERIDSNLSSSLPCFALDSACSCSMVSSGNSLHISQIQFIFVLAVRSGLPRMSSLMIRPTANTIDLSSKSLLVSTLSGEEYRRSCNYTRSNFERSRFAKASICAILTLRKLLETKRAEGLSYRGTSALSCKCMIICISVLAILKISSFSNSPLMTESRLRSRCSKMQQKLVSSLTISLMLAISLTLLLFMSEMFLFLRISSQVVSRCNFFTVTASRVSVFSARKKEYHLVLMIRQNNRYFSINQFYYYHLKACIPFSFPFLLCNILPFFESFQLDNLNYKRWRVREDRRRPRVRGRTTAIPSRSSVREAVQHPNNQRVASKGVLAQLAKKPGQQLVKKRIEDLKAPEILIKVNYKNKRISIPINTCDEKSLSDSVMPHIIRFEHQVLRNPDFSPGSICNWRTSGRGDVLKDYYYQTSKPIKVFKDQLLEIEPIWKEKKQEHTKLADFDIIKCIGTGGFSRVFLARLKATGVFYALKLMEKEGLFESGKECVVSNERNIMVDLKSPYIVNLEFAFETKHFVALALEYCPGGELFFYLRKVRKMTEDEARYCFIEILMGLQYLHGQNIIYRDIKPENIMIDMNGNLKIADFGLSKAGLKPNDLATTYCGSPEYMAPQMLAKSGHSFAVDYYCLGALLYELVTGNPPFYSRDVEKIYYAIQNQQIDFPPHIELSQEIKMLLEGLLMKQPKRRLGSMGGVREILGHPWVRKLKPADIINKTVQTPINIDLLTFNINEQEIEEGGEQFYQKFADEDQDFQPEFEDFYFNRYEDMNILDEALPSVKSQSTKENKSHKVQYSNSIKEHKINGYKSDLSREKKDYALEIARSPEPTSQLHRGKQKKNPKGQRGKKQQLNLIQRAKKHNDKSVTRTHLQRQRSALNLKKSVSPSGLKRIKSSTALLGMLKKHK